jgi:hypothetical protein
MLSKIQQDLALYNQRHAAVIAVERQVMARINAMPEPYSWNEQVQRDQHVGRLRHAFKRERGAFGSVRTNLAVSLFVPAKAIDPELPDYIRALWLLAFDPTQ